LAIALGALVAAGCRTPEASAGGVEVPAAIDHADWDRLLRTYVNERGLVAYGQWKASPEDRRALAGYLERLGAVPRTAAIGADRSSTLINAYNAFTIELILTKYPDLKSIRDLGGFLSKPWSKKFFTLFGGRVVSLDDIEHDALRKIVLYRVHAALVCAARSCPPLAREAYRPAMLDAQLDGAMARWLARNDLNAFFPDGGADVSMIFRWYREDFDAAGGVRAVVQRHGGEPARRALAAEGAHIGHLDYDWTLNDQESRP